MTYSFSKIREHINVKTIEEFKAVLKTVTPQFFNKQFEKSKSEYINDMLRLFKQIDNDFHYVWVLKQEKYAFQLKWKESVLKAHLDLLLQQVPHEFVVRKAV